MKKRALISVSDKTGVVELARELTELNFEVVSTGGTYKTIVDAGIPATYITEITNFPEILGGRVKTLHPFVHGGILAMRTPEHLAQLKELGIAPIDLVVVNLYPFRDTVAKENVTLAEAIENIDIGGPTMVRAAAKNYKYVTVIVNPDRYNEVVEKIKAGTMDEATRLALAIEAFTHTAEYDSYISTYLKSVVGSAEKFPENTLLLGEKIQDLRYGENPHQQAAFYRAFGSQEPCVGTAAQLQGKELSFNNIVDLNAALELVREFSEPAATVVKHTNPCGTALGEDILEAYTRAYEADPKSAYGGIVAVNREIDEATAKQMAKTFLEAIIAPSFSAAALEVFSAKSKLRLLSVGEFGRAKEAVDFKRVNGGILLQTTDNVQVKREDLQFVTQKRPTEAEIDELLFAMNVVKHVKSNAIVVSKDHQIIGVGAGQMNRVGSATIAFDQAGDLTEGAVLASDAYLPFRDTIDEAAERGITAVIEPGGSIRDQESIDAANEAGIAMVFTGIRHFKH